MKNFLNKMIILIIIPIISFIGFVTIIMAVPKKIINAKPGYCIQCHENKVLPDGHKDTEKMGLKDCIICHNSTKKGNLKTKLTGSHFHMLSGIGCDDCHGNNEIKNSVEYDKCINCHDVDKLVEKTKNLKPENPHTSPHYGKNLDCNLCHHQHSKSENYCNQCHNFNFIVP